MPPTHGNTRVEKIPYRRAEGAIRRLRKFENRRHAARFQHAQQFLQTFFIIRRGSEIRRRW